MLHKIEYSTKPGLCRAFLCNGVPCRILLIKALVIPTLFRQKTPATQRNVLNFDRLSIIQNLRIDLLQTKEDKLQIINN